MIKNRSAHYLIAKRISDVVGPFPTNVHVGQSEDNPPSVIIVWGFGKAYHVMLEAHYDKGHLTWDHGFFSPDQSLVNVDCLPDLEAVVPFLQRYFSQCEEPLLPFGTAMPYRFPLSVQIKDESTIRETVLRVCQQM